MTLLSNTYILCNDAPYENGVWIIDPGDGDLVVKWLNDNDKEVKGILVTHSHFDHICGINHILAAFHGISVYCSKNACKGLFSSKINASYYTEEPFELAGNCETIVIGEGDRIVLWKGLEILVFYTPGHSDDSLSFMIGNIIFTGDALIPGVNVYSKKYRTANREDSIVTCKRIIKLLSHDTLILAGHGNIVKACDTENTKFIKLNSDDRFERCY